MASSAAVELEVNAAEVQDNGVIDIDNSSHVSDTSFSKPRGQEGDDDCIENQDRKASVDNLLANTIADIKEESQRYSKIEQLPWMSKDGHVIWAAHRIAIAKLLRSQAFESIMGLVIISNILLIWWETDANAECFPAYKDDLAACPTNTSMAASLWWVRWADHILLGIYTAEAVVGIYALRETYFKNSWNLLDFFIVVAGLSAEAFENLFAGFSMSFFRIYRVARLVRIFRAVLGVRELYMLIKGVASSFKAMFFGTIILMCMLFFWGILLVEFAHELNTTIDVEYEGCVRCPRAFRSVGDSILTLFQQIVAGDSWGLVSLPLIDRQPLLAILLLPIVLSISLGIMNLILAVIVESAAEARANDLDRKQKEKQKELLKQKVMLVQLCRDMDADLSGTLSVEELREAWDKSDSFRTAMVALEVGKEDINHVFKILDPDGIGEVVYKEFVDQIYQLRTSDMRMMMALVQSTCNDLTADMNKLKPKMEEVDNHTAVLERHDAILNQIDTKLTKLITRHRQKSAAAATPGRSRGISEAESTEGI